MGRSRFSPKARRLSTDAKTKLYLFHGRLSIGAEYIGLGARTYKNHCTPVLIAIDPEFVVLENSQIRADAFGGPGGNIQITMEVLLADPASSITASSVRDVDGEIDIRATVTNLSDVVTPLLPAFASVAALLRDHCAAQLQEGTVSSLVARERPSVPAAPDGILPSRFYNPKPAAALSSKAKSAWQPIEAAASHTPGDGRGASWAPQFTHWLSPADFSMALKCEWLKP